MENGQLNWVANFIWGIADDVLRDLYVRGKYRDVILPMLVLRRLDAVLEPTKQAVLEMKARLDAAGITNQDLALRQAAGRDFYNTSKFTLSDLKARASQQQLRADFEAWLDGFSSNGQEIINNFEFRNQVPRLSRADALGTLIEKILSPEISLSPYPILNADGSVKHPGLDNHGAGTVFEELVRRFNEENNEEAGEHWTPRDAVKLMAHLIFQPIADRIESGTYLLYDGALGTGGMLTVAEDKLKELSAQRGKQVSVHLFGQEINAETYAICKADMLLKGEGAAADNIVGGPEHSTLSNDAFPSREFDFMLSNPPYGKSWKLDLERMGGKEGIKDPRFVVMHGGEPLSLVTRSSDGQLMFLANMVSKMKRGTSLGSRIAEVHNGSSLFTGDAGQGESNIRRYLIENDWLEAIVALPLNMFYNTGIATYIWVVANRKPEYRRGKIQLIDATEWYKPLRKNLGKKNCELSDEDIERICRTYLDFKETPKSKIFSNAAFGYWKVTVERPLRLQSQLTAKAVDSLRYASGDEDIRAALYDRLGDSIFEDFDSIRGRMEEILNRWGDAGEEEETDEGEPRKKGLPDKTKKRLLDPATWKRDGKLFEAATPLRKELGDGLFEDHNVFREKVDAALDKFGMRLSASDRKTLLRAMSSRTETSPPVIAKIQKAGKAEPNPLYGLYEAEVGGKKCVVEYEPDPELRDTEQISFLEAPNSDQLGDQPTPETARDGIEAFFRREVLPFAPDAWIDRDSTKAGYEISFTRHFYQPKPLRALEEIRADILALEKETEGLLVEIIGGGKP
jgi:type I restriction enzyme M protein